MAGRTGKIPVYGSRVPQFGVDYTKSGARNTVADNAMLQKVNKSLDAVAFSSPTHTEVIAAAPAAPAAPVPGAARKKNPKVYGGGGPEMGWQAGGPHYKQRAGTWNPPSYPNPPWNDETYHPPTVTTEPQVHHKQYNSPIGLYNQGAAKEALQKDIGGAAKTVSVKGGGPEDIVDSPTRQLVLRDDEWKAKTGHTPNMKDIKAMKEYGAGIAPMIAYKEEPVQSATAMSDF